MAGVVFGTQSRLQYITIDVIVEGKNMCIKSNRYTLSVVLADVKRHRCGEWF
jgi:hypothetical protein